MKKLKKSVWKSFAILSWSLISCATKPPDVFVFENYAQHLATDPVTQHLMLVPSPLCMEKLQEAECGHGVSIITGQEIFVGEGTQANFRDA